MKRILPILCAFIFLSTSSSAQSPQKPTSSEIYEAIKKLNFLGSVLYIAAHPDDENTRLISYFANDVKARTAYLSLTRGDGGQNLIGPEIRELLGVIRTQELLAARSTDGGEQFFTRANDFGYSKHPDETLEIWNKEAVLGDVVWAIRKFQPDIIVNRFSHKLENFGKTHGHHTSSAVLSELAFDLVGDATKYPEQLKYTTTWQPKREFYNTSWWRYGSRENFEKVDKSSMLSFDIGAYYSSLGLSNTEISSLSRSMHKSQGFGSTGSRGEMIEYLELVKGDMPLDKSNIFEGINTTWTRVDGGEAIGKILHRVEQNFDFKNPAASVSELIKAYKLIQNIENEHWREQKSKEIKEIILASTGLYLEAVSSESSATKNSSFSVSIEAINRSDFPMKLRTVSLSPLNVAENPLAIMKNNIGQKYEMQGFVPIDMEYTSPYWLTKKGTLGMYRVDEQTMIGMPNTPRELIANFVIDFDGYSIDFQKDIVYKYNNPVKGEVYKPFEIIPKVTAQMTDKVIIFPDGSSKNVSVKIKAGSNNIRGKVLLAYPNDWQVTPKYQVVSIAKKGAEQTVSFKITPPPTQSEGLITPMVKIGAKTYTDALIEIEYDHIPFQSVLIPSESKIVRLDIKKKGQLIGYIQGAGDEIPASLRQVGYTVVELKEEDVSLEKLQNFDAVVMGIRAYNTNEKVKFYQDDLHQYVKQGGTLMVQYNTNHRLKVAEVAPLKLKLSRDRVTDENSEVKIIKPDHEVMQFPNQITEKDFDGWVQERGLYFPDEWGKEFTPILSMNDKGESAKKGSLLVAKYGKGYYIYTGLSFFRELPAGVSGAYRLYTNLLSVGKNKKEQEIKN
ncbi:MAG: PIG-L family deacetylase [Urechidicola sp.]|nr:PIG-L family deacetylase [Urechidicola sp.]